MSTPPRAGVIGASGIGKHHAKWLNALGCSVVAFAGTSQASVEATARALTDLFGFSGRGYVGAETMLDAAELDLVAICSPPALHPQHFSLAAQRGCHIMCEKPLAWNPEKETSQLIDEASQMVATAREKGIVAAVNTQYVAAVPGYLRLCEQAGVSADPRACKSFFMQMDSRGRAAGAAGEGGTRIWIDLAPHPLSVLTAFVGPGAIVRGSEQCAIESSEVNACFEYLTAEGRRVQAHIRVRNVPEGALVRRFGIDDVLVDYEGRNDEGGVFAAYLRLGDTEMKDTDFVQTSLTCFVAAARGDGEPLASVADGLANLEMQLHLLDIGRLPQ